MQTLIQQYIAAVAEWSKETGQSVKEILDYALFDIGALNYPSTYSVDAVANYLEEFAAHNRLAEYILVPGLIHAAETHLLHLVVDFDKRRERNLAEADEVEQIADNPVLYSDEFERYRHTLSERRMQQGKLEPGELISDSEVTASLRNVAQLLRRLTNDPENNEAERKYWVEVWRRLTAPILDYKNLDWAVGKRLDLFGGKSRPDDLHDDEEGRDLS